MKRDVRANLRAQHIGTPAQRAAARAAPRTRYRPSVYFTGRLPIIPFTWKSHGYIGIATDDATVAGAWIHQALAAGYTLRQTKE